MKFLLISLTILLLLSLATLACEDNDSDMIEPLEARIKQLEKALQERESE